MLASALAVLGACGKKDATQNERPPPPPPLVPTSVRSDLCAGGGGRDTDQVSAPLIPRAGADLGGYCLDPQSEPKTYGDQGKLSMEDVCTTAFDGECEVYK
ncbi:MAG: DUF6599 family protein, partial [Polyangiaceae bacterium]